MEIVAVNLSAEHKQLSETTGDAGKVFMGTIPLEIDVWFIQIAYYIRL